jgi:hypothetical protein
MLEALIHRQDDHLAGASEGAGREHPAQVLQGARGIGTVPTQDLVDA